MSVSGFPLLFGLWFFTPNLILMTPHSQKWQIPSAVQWVLLSLSFLFEETWGKLGVLPLLFIIVSFHLQFSSLFFFLFFPCHTFSSTHLNYKFITLSSILTAFSSPWAYLLALSQHFPFSLQHPVKDCSFGLQGDAESQLGAITSQIDIWAMKVAGDIVNSHSTIHGFSSCLWDKSVHCKHSKPTQLWDSCPASTEQLH